MEINNNKNYYKTLGFGDTDELGSWKLNVSPTDRDVKVAYRNLSKKYHPDVSKEKNAKIVFEEIVEAYKILSSKDRDEYNKTSRFGTDYDDTLELYDFEFSNESNTITITKDKAKSYDKSNIVDILVELDEFQSKITYDRWLTCNHCDGTGLDMDKDTFECDMCDSTGEFMSDICTSCNGVGKLSFDECPKCDGDRLKLKEDTLKLTQDMFTDNESIIKMRGNNDKFKVGRIGDLYVRII